MWEIDRLKRRLDLLTEELNFLAARKNKLNRLLSAKGYSIKTIKGHRYLYVWTTVGHGKAKWKSLGNIKNKPDLISKIKDDRVKSILEELAKIEEREEELREKLLQAYQVLSS